MAVRQRNLADKHASDDRYNELKQRLMATWTHEPTKDPSPDILEELDRNQRVIHVFVTWDEWADLDAHTRSEMIVEAFQEVKGEAAILDLALARGLTQAEAATV